MTSIHSPARILCQRSMAWPPALLSRGGSVHFHHGHKLYGSLSCSISRVNARTEAGAVGSDLLEFDDEFEDMFGEQEEETAEEEELDLQPWLGAIMFHRSSAVSHFEFHTTLERLDLARLSTEESRRSASAMDLGSSSNETGVTLSVDVEKVGSDLILEGTVKTAMAVTCRRCAGPVVHPVCASVSLGLTSSPLVEPTRKSLGVVLGFNKYESEHPDEDGSETLDLDMDDKIYFPLDERQVDLSKYVRDTLHLEIPIGAICRPNCRGMCLSCGVNLNVGKCGCRERSEIVDPRWSALKNLKKKL